MSYTATGIDYNRSMPRCLVWLTLCALAATACRRDPRPPPPADARAEAAAPRTVTPRVAIERALAWMATVPADRLRFDAAIGTSAIRQRAPGAAADRAWAVAQRAGDADRDSPLRRAFDPTARAPASSTAGWAIPRPGEPPANVNRVVAEALHCADNGLRPETIAYATGPMRDAGGYRTAHALWALAIARDQRCLDGARFEALARPLIEELRAAEPAAPAGAARELDLFAERLLMLELAGERDIAVERWAGALIGAQDADGGFGALAAGEDPYVRYHATMAAAWALALRL